ncbi:MAG: S41 family peptidase [Eubacteriales bacterium]
MRLRKFISLLLVLTFVLTLSPVYAKDYTYSEDFDALLTIYEENSYYEYTRQEAVDKMIRTLLENYPELYPYLADSLMKSGDQYSGYYDKEQIDSAFGDTYEGFGFVMTYVSFKAPYQYGLKVDQVFSGSPADMAGIKEGDIITSVNGCSVSFIGFQSGLEYLSQAKGKVTLGIQNGDGVSEVVLERATVTQTHFTVEKLSDKSALITISDFNGEDMVADFYYDIKQLEDDGVDSLVFDVRGNGGGSLDIALNMINILVPEADKRITKVLYREGESFEVSTTGIGFDFDKIVILADEQSFSAAEFFAICVRELCGAAVVGAKTPGKAIGQSYYPLEDGGVAGITEIEITSPNGTRYNKVGVVPEYAIKSPEVLKASLRSKYQLNMFNMAQIVPSGSGEAVSALQERLVNAGVLSPAAVTGVYDRTTRDALRVFSVLSGLGDSSKITSKVIAALNTYSVREVSYYEPSDPALDKAKQLLGVG